MSKTTTDKVRVYALAKELKVENKHILEVCQELGFAAITNQLHGLEPAQVDAVKKRLKDGPKSSTPAAPAPPKTAAPVIPPPVVGSKVRTLPPPKPKPAPAAKPSEPEPAPTPPPAPVEPQPLAPVPEVAETAPPAPAVQPTPEPSLTPASPPPASPPPVSPPPLPPAGSPYRGMPNLTANRPPTLHAAGGRPVGARTACPRPPSPAPPAPPTTLSQPPAAPAPPPVQAAPAGEPPAVPTASPPTVVVSPPPTPVPAPPPRPQMPPPMIGGNRPPSLNTPRPQAGPSAMRPPQGSQGTPGQGPRPNPTAPTSSGGSSPTGSAAGPRQGPPNPPPRSPGGPGGGYGGAARGPSGPGGPSGLPSGPSGFSGPGGPAGGPRPGPPNPPPPSGARPAPNVAAKGGTSIKLTPEQIAKLREAEKKKGARVGFTDVQRVVSQQPPDRPPSAPGEERGAGRPGTVPGGGPRPPARGPEDDDKPKRGPGEVAGRDQRTKHRNRDRGGKGPTDKGSIIIGAGGQVDVIEQAAGSRKGPRAALIAKLKRKREQEKVKKAGPVEIALPITVRSLSEAIGMKVGELSKLLLKETQQLYGANSPVSFEVAELIAINKDIQLVAKKVETREDILLRRFKEQAEQVEEDKLRPRPPIVTIMGHVDHGKTSLLDKIRQEFGIQSDVVSTEAGGITQVIRAWRVEKDGKPTTFLDTPGHEAFTKMRARGAKVTDIAVIVVAATDGVMPQTEEAISHAKAADVEIIVAINKIDMPNANVDKTRRQLYSLGLLPDDMGGEVPFVETSAVTGDGIAELLDTIALVAELSELKADPEHKPSGTCLEASKDDERGVLATLIVQQGTLRQGDVILCGATFGRVRAMFDDLGRPIDQAGPSTPVKVIGLDAVPNADDPFYFVDDLSEAQEIAEMRKQREIEASRTSMAPKSLDALREATARAKITELKVVLKAEARGSVEAIRKELEKLVHEEVRCRVLHSGIGAITESDVTLALTSPADTLIIGFNVTADDAALRLAEERNISIREYDIIYKLTDDVKAALEGRLKPIEEVVHLGRAVVRETFKISKVGTIAGCYVTSGVLERSARVRVIREGTVIYPPSDKTLGLDSLKRFKDDAKEVREGFECGLKITGFDDVKVGDVIEAFRIEIRQRTL